MGGPRRASSLSSTFHEGQNPFVDSVLKAKIKQEKEAQRLARKRCHRRFKESGNGKDTPAGGFLSDITLFEVYEDLLERRAATDRFCCIMVHSKRLRLAKRSCFIFREEWAALFSVRQLAVWIAEWPLFERAVLSLILLNALTLALPAAYNSPNANGSERDLMATVNLVSVIVFTIECILKIIARGLFFSPAPDPCYLRDPLNYLDLFVVCTSLFELIVLQSGDDNNKAFVLMRMLRVVRPLRSLNVLPHLRMTVVTLFDSTQLLGQWLLFMLFFLMLFAILGNSLFSVSYWQRCRLTPAPIDVNGTLQWPIDLAQSRFCGGMYSCLPTADGRPTWCGSPVTEENGVVPGYDPWPELQSSRLTDYGTTGFHNFLVALLTVFEVATREGWTILLYRYQDAHGPVVPTIFFCCVVLGGSVLLNIALAILGDAFGHVLRRFEPLRLDRTLEDEEIPPDILVMRFSELVEQVTSAEDIIGTRRSTNAHASLGMKNVCSSISQNEWFENVMLLVVLANASILAADTYPPQPDATQKILDTVNLICIILFIGELLIKMLGFGVDFFADQFNLFDLLFIGMSLIEVMSGGSSAFAALRVARFLRLFKRLPMTESLRVLLRVLRKVVIPAYNFGILVALFAYSLVLLGLQLFYPHSGSNAKLDLSFDDLVRACISVFAILIGQDWNEHMMLMLGTGVDHAACLLYYIGAYVLGNLILMRLLVGIMVCIFAYARDELIQDFRQRMFDVRYPLEAMGGMWSLEPEEEEQEEEEDSPRWPDDWADRRIHFVWPAPLDQEIRSGFRAVTSPELREGPSIQWALARLPDVHLGPKGSGGFRAPNSKAIDMHFLKMMQVKQAAASRKWRQGEKVVFRPVIGGLEGTDTVIMFGDPSKHTEALNRSVSFAHGHARAQERPPRIGFEGYGSSGSMQDSADLEVPLKPPVLAVAAPNHNRLPPTSPDAWAIADCTDGEAGVHPAFDGLPNLASDDDQEAPRRPPALSVGSPKHRQGPPCRPRGAPGEAALPAKPAGATLPWQRGCANSSASPRGIADYDACAGDVASEADVPRVTLGAACRRGDCSRTRRAAESLEYSSWTGQSQDEDEAPRRPPALSLDRERSRAMPSSPRDPAALARAWMRPPPLELPQAPVWGHHHRAVLESVSEGLNGLDVGGLRRRRLSSPSQETSTSKDERSALFRSLVRMACAPAEEPSTAADASGAAAAVAREDAGSGRCPGSARPASAADIAPMSDQEALRQLGRMKRVSPQALHGAQPPEAIDTGLMEVSVEVSEEVGVVDPSQLRGSQQMAHLAKELKNKQLQLQRSDSPTAGAEANVSDRESSKNSVPRRGRGSSTFFLNIAASPAFDPCVLGLIVLSSITLAIESPYIEYNGQLGLFLQVVDKIAIFAFTFEMIVRMGAFGMCKSPITLPPTCKERPYFRTPWNWIDLAIVVVGWLDFIMSLASSNANSMKVVRAIRVLRVIRPLRLVKRAKALRVLVDGLVQSLATLSHVAIIATLLYLGFSILLLNQMKGALWHCSLDPDGDLRSDIDNKVGCLERGGEWLNRESNFDNLWNSVVTLLHVSTGEGWVETMTHMASSRGVDLQPRRFCRISAALPLLFFIILSNVFIANLVVGVLVDQYRTVLAQIDSLENLDEEDKLWLKMQRDVFFDGPVVNRIVLDTSEVVEVGQARGHRSVIRHCMETRVFDYFVLLVILANSLCLCLDHPTMSREMGNALEAISISCVCFFTVEAVLKLLAYRRYYFKDGWNILDFVATLISIVGVIINAAAANTRIASFVRAFRVMRAMRLMKYFVFLDVMFQTMRKVVPSLVNITSLSALIMFMYACLGVGLFGTIKDGPIVGAQSNLRSFGNAMLLLLRGSTGEKWHKVMYELASNQPGCTHDMQTPQELERDGPQGCGSWLAYPYFLTYEVLVSTVFVNLIVAVTIEVFREVRQRNAVALYEVLVQELVDAWEKRDVECTGFVPLEEAIDLLLEVRMPVGFAKSRRKHVLHSMRFLPLHSDNRIHFRDLIILVARRSYIWLREEKENSADTVGFNTELLTQWILKFPDLPFEDIYEGECTLIAHVIIASHVQAFIARKQEEWRVRREKQAAEEEAAKANGGGAKSRPVQHLQILTDESPGDTGTGVGVLDVDADADAALPSEDGRMPAMRQNTGPSMLMTQLAVPATETVPQLSPLPWPPPLPKATRSK